MAKKKKSEITVLSSDQEIVRQAKKRMMRCDTWESEFRTKFVNDVKFANADPDNGWQWEDQLRQSRTIDKRPSLTINKTRQHNLQIINDAKQNKPGVKISPTGGTATYEAAKIFMGIIRHIEYKSSAEQCYDMATKFQVEGGIGYFRVLLQYVNDKSFDQEPLVAPIDDPLSVYLDPDIREIDGSDARFGFIFSDMPVDEFDDEYPDFAGEVGDNVISMNNGPRWITEDHIRVAEYFRKVPVDDRLIFMVDPETGKQDTVLESEVPKNIVKLILADPKTKTRKIQGHKIEWYKIAGDKIIDRNEYPGKYIPIIRVIGEETKINGKLDRKGHTRSMKDAQRMYNYWTSAGVEFVALQSIAPWIIANGAVEGHETFWNTANTERHAYLPWNHLDEDGQPLPSPSRPAPPVTSSAYIQGMQIAQNEMMLASGQYQSQFGEKENATAGVAINARQRQGERATYHYVDGLGIAIKFLGKILLDLIPKVLDTERTIMIMGEDGSESEVQVDPEAKQAFMERKNDQKEGKASIIFNPNIGDYAVQADVGPSFATKRQEAFNAFTQLASQSEMFMSIAGDIMFKAADFPMADELAERYRRMVPQQALGEAPPPEIQAMLEQGQMQVKNMQAVISQMAKTLSEKELALAAKEQDFILRRYQAQTQRFGVVANAKPELGGAVLPIAAQTEAEMLDADGGPGGMPGMTMGGQVTQGFNGNGEVFPLVIAALERLAQGQSDLQRVVMAPRRRELTKGADGRPNGSVDRVMMEEN